METMKYWLEHNLPVEFWEDCNGTPSSHIAKAFECNPKIIIDVRKKLGFSADKNQVFKRRFNKKHGAGSYDTLIRMFEDPLISLSDVGDRFNFSREAASIFFKKLHNKGYRECNTLRAVCKIKPKVKGLRFNLHQRAVDILSKNKLIQGHHIGILPYRDRSYKIQVNEIYARVFHTYRILSNNKIFFSSQKEQDPLVSFFLYFAPFAPSKEEVENMYIIPANLIIKSGLSVIPEDPTYFNNFQQLIKLYG